MKHEFRVGSAAEFVNVHPEALAVCLRTEGNNAIENPEEQVDHRQDEAEQRGDSEQLGKELAALGSEQARGCKTPESGRGMNADRSRWVVDGESELK